MAAESGGRRPTVLVVDDDVSSARAVAHALSDDYDVWVAQDGVEGLVAARTIHPDLVITDVMMPKLDGFRMVRQMREGMSPSPAVIFLTARDTPLDAIQGSLVGAVRYLAKPVSLDALADEVRAVLREGSAA